MAGALPYKIAVLCYLFDEAGRVLLLHRQRPPNQNLYSPVGGKLDQGAGESPTACAVREIAEETRLDISTDRLHLTGIVSEAGYEGESHWMMFLYEVSGAVRVTRMSFEEGRLEWHTIQDAMGLPIPETDRQVIWPLFNKYRGRFFAAHIDCTNGRVDWKLEQPACDSAVGTELLTD